MIVLQCATESVFREHRRVLWSDMSRSTTAAGEQHLPADNTLITHAHQSTTKSARYRKRRSGRKIDGVITVIIPSTQSPFHSLWPREPWIVADSSLWLCQTSNLVTSTTRVQLWGDALSRYHAANIKLQRLSVLETNKTDKPTVEIEPQVMIIDQTEQQDDVETKYFGKNQSCGERTGSYMHKKPGRGTAATIN